MIFQGTELVFISPLREIDKIFCWAYIRHTNKWDAEERVPEHKPKRKSDMFHSQIRTI